MEFSGRSGVHVFTGRLCCCFPPRKHYQLLTMVAQSLGGKAAPLVVVDTEALCVCVCDMWCVCEV